MGSAHSIHTNLGKDSTSFNVGSAGTKALWGDFEVSLGNWKENNDQTQVWSVKYKTIHEKHFSCGFQLKANLDNNGLESINFGLGDSSPNNETKFALKITRVARDGLAGGITGVDSSSGAAPASFTRAKENCTIETTIVSYGCSKRDGLFILEMKKKTSSENAYMVTLAHYYVAKDVGLSVTAKIGRGNKNGAYGFGVEIEGPMKHPSTDLHKVIAKTCRTGVWSPNACSHCSNGGKGIRKGSKIGVSNNNNDSSLAVKDNHHHESSNYEVEEAVNVDQVVKHDGMFWNHVIREQYNKGLINSSGHTSGSLNNSIIFMNCNF